jgi:hypothetical protein
MPLDQCVGRLTSQGVTQPMLFKLQGSYWIKTDRSAIRVMQDSCFDDCVELLLFSFFVFNVSYPPELKIVFGLLERLMKLKPSMPRSATLDDFIHIINIQ